MAGPVFTQPITQSRGFHGFETSRTIVQASRLGCQDGYGRMKNPSLIDMVKLILRATEYEVKPGMTLLSALQKSNIIPESVIAMRNGEMILEDEILKDGEVIKLVAVISGGSNPSIGNQLP